MAFLPRYTPGFLAAVVAVVAFCPTDVHATAAADVPEVLALGYQLVYSKALTDSYGGGAVTYDINNSGTVGANFDRVAYYLELQIGAGARQYVYVSLPRLTGMTSLAKIGIPVSSTGELYQELFTNMNVFSNVAGIVTGTGITTGSIEFWSSNYSGTNARSVPNANGAFDFGDSGGGTGMGYGSMQIHNYDLDGAGAGIAGQTLFAYNRFGNTGLGNSDLGIGNRATTDTDWTFASNAATYTIKNLEILVHPVPEPTGLGLLAFGSLLLGGIRRARRA